MAKEQPDILDYLHLNLIMQMRIYDALLLLIGKDDKNAAAKLMRDHENFEFLGSYPFKEIDEDNS